MVRPHVVKTEAQFYKARNEELKNLFRNWEPHYKQLSEYFAPRRNQFLGKRDQATRGSRINASILDETTLMAARTFGSGMHAGVTSPSRPWFRLTTEDSRLRDIAAVKNWLHNVEKQMRLNFARSNLYNVLPSLYKDLGIYGTAAMSLLEDDKDAFRAHLYPIGSYALAVNERLSVDTMYREIRLTVRQLVMQFGINNCSRHVQAMYRESNYEKQVDVLHLIEPNFERDPRFQDAQNMPIRSVYLEMSEQDNKFLRKSGFMEQPFMAPRFEVVGEDPYASNCPGMMALGSARGLQKEVRRKLEAIEKMVNPPLQAPTSLRNQYSSLLPGDVTYVDASSPQGGVRPIFEVNPRINELQQDIFETQQRISQSFFADLFLMLTQSDRRQITAREVEERHEEKLLMLGPVLENIHTELLDPLVERAFGMMERNGEIADPPPQLEGEPLKVEYISILAQAQQAVGIAGIERTMGFVGNMAGINPDILDKIDFDQTVDEYSSMSGVPPTIIRSDDMVESLRAARAQQQQAAQMAEMAGPIKDSAQAAKLLSETDGARVAQAADAIRSTVTG